MNNILPVPRSRSVSVGLALFLSLAFCLPAPGQKYTITDLNEPSDSYRLAYGINSAGDVVGEYGSTNGLRLGAFVHRNGTNSDLGVLAGYVNSYAYGINDDARIVGWCDAMSGLERAFLYSSSGMANLGTLGTRPAMGYSEAFTINRTGRIVGTASLTHCGRCCSAESRLSA